MKIALTADPFIPVPPENYGGIERIIHFLVEGLIRKGHEVRLVAHKDSFTSAKLIPYSSTASGLFNHLDNVLTINKLKNFNPDIIHSFSRLAYLMPFLPTRIPKLMSYQREPTISQIKKAVKVSAKGSLYFTGCSNYISDQIKPFAPSFSVFNGVDTDFYKFNEKIEEDAPLVFLGRVEPIKGTHNAIAVAKQTGKKLIIAGNIPSEYKSYFIDQVKPELNERITYVGPVNDDQKNEMLRNALAFLMPIEWNEPFGIVMAEALACGTPVLGFGYGAVKEVVVNNLNGYICENISDMARRIESIESISRKKVRKDAELRFSSEVITDQYIDIYERISAKK